MGGPPQCPGLSHSQSECGLKPADITNLARDPLLRTHGRDKRRRQGTPSHQDWIDPLPFTANTHIIRHTDVSQDPRDNQLGLTLLDSDDECTTTPSRLPPWVLPQEETQTLFHEGHGTQPDLIYAIRVPDTPDTPDPCATNFDKKLCNLILIEIGFSRDLGCDKKHTENNDNY